MIVMSDEKFYWIGRLFSQYLDASIKFNEFYEAQHDEEISYHIIAKDTNQPRRIHDNYSLFYKLKETAHKTRKLKTLDDVERSLCWIIESACSNVFHELTIIRESLYQSYRNQKEKKSLESCIMDGNCGFDEISDSLKIINENDEYAKSKIEPTFEKLVKVVEIPKKMFRYLLKLEINNHFIMSSVYENFDKIRLVYGEEEAKDFLEDVFSMDEEKFLISYRDSLVSKGFYAEAININDKIPEELKADIDQQINEKTRKYQGQEVE